MTVVYLDTSVLGRLLLGEPDTPAIVRELGAFEQLMGSRLLAVELRRLALREGFGADAERLLADVSLVPIDEGVLSAAEVLAPATVATLDAIHLATALRLASGGDLDALMTYDNRLADGARHHGIAVLAPG